MGRPIVNLAGKIFGRLTAIEFRRNGDLTYWMCKCRCGLLTEVQRSNLQSGSTLSCGCLHSERARKRYMRIGRLRIKHGDAKRNLQTSEYQAWQSMKRRCYNSHDHKYVDYGQRGINVCKQWKESYLTFLFGVGRRPQGGYVLDRVNNNGKCMEHRLIFLSRRN